jgi:hypothetical protein
LMGRCGRAPLVDSRGWWRRVPVPGIYAKSTLLGNRGQVKRRVHDARTHARTHARTYAPIGPNSPLQRATGNAIGGYTRDPEAAPSKRKRVGYPPACGEWGEQLRGRKRPTHCICVYLSGFALELRQSPSPEKAR